MYQLYIEHLKISVACVAIAGHRQSVHYKVSSSCSQHFLRGTQYVSAITVYTFQSEILLTAYSACCP
jgi:hypothetical protein